MPTVAPSIASTYSSAYVRLLFDYLAAQGLDAERVLGQAAPRSADRGLTQYPLARWRDLLEKAAAALQDPLLGLHLGRCIGPAHLGVLGYVLLACPDLGSALLRWQQYERLIAHVAVMTVRQEGNSLVIAWAGPEPLGRLIDETALTSVVQFWHNLSGKPAALEEVCFRHPAPANLRPYRHYFGCPVRFDQPLPLLRFPAHFLNQPLRQPDAVLLDMMEHQAQALLAELPQVSDLGQTVRNAIARLAREGEIGIGQVARELCVSPRTLQRRLTESGLQFRALREDTRCALAIGHLKDSRLTLGEIAWLLGYSEPSAFTRAFGRWIGQSPSLYREALR